MSRYELETKLTPSTMNQLSVLLLGSLPQRLAELRLTLSASEFSQSDLPISLKNRQISIDGRAKLDIYPAGNMQSRVELKDFVRAVQSIAPNATGAPIMIFEAGNTVMRAFTEAAITTVILVSILVLLLTRQLRQITLIFAPLILAALMTGAASAIFSLPFNFANVIVLPLLFGLGIAGCIHMVMREKQMSHLSEMTDTTTPRAVMFSLLTTIGSFGSISLSSHPGTSSMGILLTIAIFCTLICTLLLLPALMDVWPIETKKARH